MKRGLKPFVALLVLLLLAEEWLWDHLKRCVARLGALPGVRAFEARLRALPPWASLLVMLLPAAVLLPFKLAALWALGHGHRVLGFLVFVAAKLVGTGLAAYLFDLVRDSARQVKAFDRFYGAVMRLLARGPRLVARAALVPIGPRASAGLAPSLATAAQRRKVGLGAPQGRSEAAQTVVAQALASRTLGG